MVCLQKKARKGAKTMNERKYRDTLGKFATGITVITTDYQSETIGMTVNAFMSISLDPKLIAISIDQKTRMYNLLEETKSFGISMLREQQQDLSLIFAKQLEAKEPIQFEKLGDVHVLEDPLAAFECHVQDVIVAGDHKIFIAEVKEFKANDGEPVLYFGGKYRNVQPN